MHPSPRKSLAKLLDITASDTGYKYLYSLVDNFTIMDDSKEYQIYLEALDEERSAWSRRTAVKKLSELKSEESLYYLNELVVDRYCVVPDWLKKIAREYYVCLCLEFL